MGAFDQLHRAELFDQIQKALDGPHGDNATLYARTVALVSAANFPEPTRFSAQIIAKLLERCEELNIPAPHYQIVIRMLGAGAGLYAAERFGDLPPNPALYGFHNDNPVLGRIRDLLLQQQSKALQPNATLEAFSNAVIASFLAIARALPSLAHDDKDVNLDASAANTIPIIDLVPNIGAIIERALEPFSSSEVKQFGLFRWLRSKLDDNTTRLTTRSRSSHPTPPSQYSGTPAGTVVAYLRDTTLDSIFLESRVPFHIPQRIRFEHAAIVAGSGWGKTQLLQNIIHSDLRKEDPPSLIVLDSTGMMTEQIQRLAVFNDRLRDRILIIDPAHSPALNMFDISSPRYSRYTAEQKEDIQTEIIALFNYIFASGEYDLSGQMGVAFTYAVRLILTRPAANIVDLRTVLEETPKTWEQSEFATEIRALDPDSFAFFRHHFFSDSLKATRSSIARRLHGLLTIPAFKRMFTASTNTLDLFSEMQKGTVVLVNTNVNLLKEDGMALFGRYLIARTMTAAFERVTIKDRDRKPAFLIIDEAAPYFDDTFDALLTRVRQFKLGVTIAFQHLEQAGDKVRSAIAANTSIKYAARLSHADRRWMAHEMETTPEFIQSQQRDERDPNKPYWSQFACHVLGSTRSAVSLTVPFYVLEKEPQMTDAEHADLLARNRARVTSISPRETAQEVKPDPSPPIMQELAPRASPSPQKGANDPDTGAHTEPASDW